MEKQVPVRMDKWLWCVRLYHSRSLAAKACAGGQVQINGRPVKPSRPVRPGEIITVITGPLTRVVKVTALLERRTPAALVHQFLEDLTPSSEYEKAKESAASESRFEPSLPLPAPAGHRLRIGAVYKGWN